MPVFALRQKEDFMRLRLLTHVLPALVFAAGVIPTAQAGCGDPSALQPPFQFAQSGGDVQGSAQRVASAANSAAMGASVNTASIVGMWKIQLIAKGNTTIPDGALIDFGYTQFHTDGTEILNSGGRAPATENFCLGVWVRSGYFNYELNHFALSYDATTGALNGKVNIHEQITLDPSGNEYAGTFTITMYDPTSGQQVAQVLGTLSATRITVDQTTP
jgi:hypothetical protein